jgi:hypothetical protein
MFSLDGERAEKLVESGDTDGLLALVSPAAGDDSRLANFLIASVSLPDGMVPDDVRFLAGVDCLGNAETSDDLLAESLVIGRPLLGVSWLARPVVAVLTGASNLVLRAFGDSTNVTETRLSRDELQQMVDEAAASGSVDAKAGEKAMAEAMALLDKAAKHPSRRLSGMVSPSQIDTCTPELIKDSFAEAKRRRLPFQIHAAQSVVEFHEITRRHGMTPVEWLLSLGVLSPCSIIGHGIFLDSHTSAHWPATGDLETLAETGTTVAHCPVVFHRRGIALQTFGRYVAAGVAMGIGTDTYPHNMLEEMRAVAITARLMAEDVYDLRTADVFEAATLGGARALGRSDIGRLSVGAKADIVLVDVTHPNMRPVRDPMRSLIYAAADRAVKTVIVDGRTVVENGRVLTMDHEKAAADLEAAQRRAEPRVAVLDWAGRDHLKISPLMLPVRASPKVKAKPNAKAKSGKAGKAAAPPAKAKT